MALAENQVTLEVVKDGATGPQGIQGPSGEDGKSAYESAVDGGYQGTEQDFNEDLGTFSDAVNHFWTDEDGAHVTQVTQEEYLDAPDEAGGNTLITSVGMYVRDGETNVASFGEDGACVGRLDGPRTEISDESVSIITKENVKAFSAKSSTEVDSQTMSARQKYGFTEINQSGSLDLSFINIIESISLGTQFDIIFSYSGSGRRPQGPPVTETVSFVKGTPKTEIVTLSCSAEDEVTISMEYLVGNEYLRIVFTSATREDSRYYIDVNMSHTIVTYAPQTEVTGYQVWHNPDKAFVVETYTKAYSNISSGGNFSWTEDVEKEGYYPVGIVGFNAARAGLCCEFAFIEDPAVGSCTLRMHAKNTTSSAIQANTARIMVLWVKCE